MTNYVTWAEALTVACPICEAQPGQPCYGTRGKPRATTHRDRQHAYRREPRFYDLDQSYIPPEHRDGPPPVRDLTLIPDDDRTRGLAHCHLILEQLAARGLATGKATQ